MTFLWRTSPTTSQRYHAVLLLFVYVLVFSFSFFLQRHHLFQTRESEGDYLATPRPIKTEADGSDLRKFFSPSSSLGHAHHRRMRVDTRHKIASMYTFAWCLVLFFFLRSQPSAASLPGEAALLPAVDAFLDCCFSSTSFEPLVGSLVATKDIKNMFISLPPAFTAFTGHSIRFSDRAVFLSKANPGSDNARLCIPQMLPRVETVPCWPDTGNPPLHRLALCRVYGKSRCFPGFVFVCVFPPGEPYICECE